eukprot:TRINITY_DN6842_c0_g1_i1.p1 TRINITY_DN6842_c0_g1~~TRINITY_DN6842_c0_g1_i1.p1  ORF type:complete len:450 (+),score=155.02 TRINITY_DN6842_c0_g1_i1:183-1532(+)
MCIRDSTRSAPSQSPGGSARAESPLKRRLDRLKHEISQAEQHKEENATQQALALQQAQNELAQVQQRVEECRAEAAKLEAEEHIAKEHIAEEHIAEEHIAEEHIDNGTGGQQILEPSHMGQELEKPCSSALEMLTRLSKTNHKLTTLNDTALLDMSQETLTQSPELTRTVVHQQECTVLLREQQQDLVKLQNYIEANHPQAASEIELRKELAAARFELDKLQHGKDVLKSHFESLEEHYKKEVERSISTMDSDYIGRLRDSLHQAQISREATLEQLGDKARELGSVKQENLQLQAELDELRVPVKEQLGLLEAQLRESVLRSKKLQDKVTGHGKEKAVLEDTIKELRASKKLQTTRSTSHHTVSNSNKTPVELKVEEAMLLLREHDFELNRLKEGFSAVSYTHLRAHETPEHLVCRLLLEKKKKKYVGEIIYDEERMKETRYNLYMIPM